MEEIALQSQAFGSRSNKSFKEVKVDFFPIFIIYKINKQKNEICIRSIHHSKKHPRKKFRKG